VEAIMTHLVDKNFVERANTVLLLGILWAGFAICVLGACLLVGRLVRSTRSPTQRFRSKRLLLPQYHSLLMGTSGVKSSF
jgi:hypothetical protein